MPILVFFLSYLSGSIPFGLLLGRMAGRDVRESGSRNIGATNVWRVCGGKWGVATFACDFLKGLLPVCLLSGLVQSGVAQPYSGIIAGAGAVLGHNYPLWLRFKGGKGVATSAGAVAGLMWLPFALAIGVFIVTVAVTRYLSLGSMIASVALVAAVIACLPDPFGANLPLFILSAALAAMLLLRHRQNIARIVNGTENRFPPPRAP